MKTSRRRVIRTLLASDWTVERKIQRGSSPAFVHSEKTDGGAESTAAVRPPRPPRPPDRRLPLSVPLLSVSVSWSVLHRWEAKQGGGAPLGRLAQLYLLLDDTSRVVDERVDQASHCGSRPVRK